MAETYMCYVSAICKHIWDYNMYAAFTHVIPRRPDDDPIKCRNT